MGQIIINGVTYSGNNIVIRNNKAIIDGNVVELPDEKQINISIVGNIDTLVTSSANKIEVTGNVSSHQSGSGDITVKGDVGSIQTGSGDVKCNDVHGNIKTGSGDVYCQLNSGNIKM